MFKRFHSEVEKQNEKCIKILRSDRGSEYLTSDFLIYLEKNEILSQWTPPGTSQYNRMSERRNRIPLDIVWSMMGFAKLSIFFWRYAFKTTCYTFNKVLSKSVNKTPYKIQTRCGPVISHLRVWGYPVYVKHLKIDKLGSKFDKYLFVGYPKEIKGYYFYLAKK